MCHCEALSFLSLRDTECRGNLGGASGGVFRFPSPPIHRDCFVAGAPRKDRMGWPRLLRGVYPEPDSSVAEFILSERFFAAPSLHSGLRLITMTQGKGLPQNNRGQRARDNIPPTTHFHSGSPASPYFFLHKVTKS